MSAETLAEYLQNAFNELSDSEQFRLTWGYPERDGLWLMSSEKYREYKELLAKEALTGTRP